MKQQIETRPMLRVGVPPEDSGRFAIVLRTWDEADQARVVRRQPEPPPPPPEIVSHRARVRYEHD